MSPDPNEPLFSSTLRVPSNFKLPAIHIDHLSSPTHLLRQTKHQYQYQYQHQQNVICPGLTTSPIRGGVHPDSPRRRPANRGDRRSLVLRRRVVDMTEHLALYNATGDTAHITNLAAVCSEILGHQPAPAPAAAQPVQSAQARVDDRLHERVVRRNKRRIARIFSGSYDTSIDDCKRAIKAFKHLWGQPTCPIKPLALYRLTKHLHLARERGMRIPKRYHRIFLEMIFENESDGKFIAWDWEDDEVMSWLKMTYNDAKEQADYFGR